MNTALMRGASYLLPDPGGKVVRECLDEIDRLRMDKLRAENSTLSATAGSGGTIPLDHSGAPAISKEMKIECLGKFTWTEEWPYYDAEGNLHADHVHTHTVPWSVCKEIYRRMATAAMKDELGGA